MTVSAVLHGSSMHFSLFSYEKSKVISHLCFGEVPADFCKGKGLGVEWGVEHRMEVRRPAS